MSMSAGPLQVLPQLDGEGIDSFEFRVRSSDVGPHEARVPDLRHGGQLRSYVAEKLVRRNPLHPDL